jgi:signal transduction histidine kinase
VLFNLLSNALRHTSPGGNICVSAARAGDAVLLTVEDDGDGLDEADLQAVFDRFYRVDKSRSRETGGSGLGLAIVKAMVQAHGGQVQVRSPGRGLGSQFVVELPGSL